MSEWPIEEIPNSSNLYMRVHVNNLADNKLHPGIFQIRGSSLSVDWDKYSTPEESRLRASNPLNNGIISLRTDQVRSIEYLKVKHDPDPIKNNRSHSGIYVDDEIKKTEYRLRLFNLVSGWEISPFQN